MSGLLRNPLTGALVLILLSGCWSPGPKMTGPGGQNAALAIHCSRWSPSMITHVMQAVVCGGGPACVEVDGWICGHTPHGILARIVFLRRVAPAPPSRELLVPVVFEEGRLVGSGERLLEDATNRYGAPILRDDGDWSAPPGWITIRQP
jgi:hypothetical protein